MPCAQKKMYLVYNLYTRHCIQFSLVSLIFDFFGSWGRDITKPSFCGTFGDFYDVGLRGS